MGGPPTKPGLEVELEQRSPLLPDTAATAGYPAAPWPVPLAAPQPLPKLPIRAAKEAPAPGSVIIAWQVVPPKGGCSCDLKPEGWLLVAILILLLPCIACIPCCVIQLQQTYQEPVYGHPGQVYGHPCAVPVAQPVQDLQP